MARISKRFVDGLKISDKQRIEWDDTLKGFGVVVRPTGNHSYVFSYRNQHNRKRNVTIAKLGGLTPAAARAKAEEFRHAVLQGRDPIAEKAASRQTLFLGDLFDAYLESSSFKSKAETTQYVDRGRIKRHLRPLLGKTVVTELDMRSVEKAFEAICAGKTAVSKPSKNKHGQTKVTGGEGAARMAIRLLRSMLGWGFKAGLVSGDAVQAARYVDIGRDGKRDLILDDPKLYAQLWAVLDRLTDPNKIGEGEKPIRIEVADAIRVIALTGARKGEILGLRWSYVDLDAGTLTLPVSAHKTGRKTGDARVIGLPALAADIIRRQPLGQGHELVFKPARDGASLDISKPWRYIREIAGLPKGIGLHGLRHSLASHMAMQGAQASEIMTALGHRDITTSQNYVHWAIDQRQVIAEKAAAGITAAIIADAGDQHG
ncbi:hypothetical protein GCM10008927_28730 [Amylibacter ulvae]|uniref:Tyr recombinase domain-containing protein n=1 Tax=Paramylibacter ulvae TaxID=1651968 RepID=A0ABQ3D6K5_9RHOB|nr:site-specific integrase [Amylibacter ulvae]GHA61493.1 hypothetical protein GCM10008927_28730 [Amylibacter ulvae]